MPKAKYLQNTRNQKFLKLEKVNKINAEQNKHNVFCNAY